MCSSSQAYLTFDGVNVNLGNGFDPVTGAFKAPRPGVYVFNFHALTQVTYFKSVRIWCVVQKSLESFHIISYLHQSNDLILKEKYKGQH